MKPICEIAQKKGYDAYEYLDGEMLESKVHTFIGHVKDCEGCQKELQLVYNFNQLLKEVQLLNYKEGK